MATPKNRSSRARKAGLAIAPIPLALALVHNALVPGSGSSDVLSDKTLTTQAVKCEGDIEDYTECHSQFPSGCSASGGYDFTLNIYKNQLKWPSNTVVKYFHSSDDYAALERKIPSELGKKNHGDFVKELSAAGEGKLHGLIGYLYDAKAEGKESSNCQLDPGDDNENVDFHIWIGFDSGVARKLWLKKHPEDMTDEEKADKSALRLTPEEKSEMKKSAAIVEMTPHYRGLFHPEWTIDELKAQIGAKVRVVGQLMVDNEHNVPSQNCGREDATEGCWRLSVWELHPVTEFQVCPDDSCKDTSGPWADLGASSSPTSAAEHVPQKSRKSTRRGA